MSPVRTVVFVGVRLVIDEADMERYETRRHPTFLACRAAKLDCYYDNFGAPGEQYYVLIGRKLGVFGYEDSAEAQFDACELEDAFRSVAALLPSVGVDGPLRLLVLFQPDA